MLGWREYIIDSCRVLALHETRSSVALLSEACITFDSDSSRIPLCRFGSSQHCSGRRAETAQNSGFDT